MIFVIKKYQNKCLHVTGSTILLSFYHFFQWYRTLSSTTILEKILGIHCICLWISTILFWKNPIQHSILHKIDAIIAKSCFVYYIGYTFTNKTLENIYFMSYIGCIGGMCTSFYLSNRASTKKWCSLDHIFYHGLLHLFAFGLSVHAYL